jgi:hypothetical protein
MRPASEHSLVLQFEIRIASQGLSAEKPNHGPEADFRQVKQPRISLSKGAGMSFPANMVEATQITTNKRVPPAAVKNTNLNAELIGG